MRKITVLFIAICLATSCSEFDDSEIWDKLNDHEYRIAYLEEVCNKMNANIVNLQTIVTALEANDYIVSASPLQDGGGYVLIFKSGKSIIINHGEDGTDGKDGVDGKNGVTPTISVMKDVDGIYYWTINGEWLLINGEKVKASAVDGSDGKDGITPQFKIENNYWYISYDNGASWEILGKATGNNGLDGINGADGNSIFSNVSQDESYVYFYLSDGTILILPKKNETNIEFEDLLVKYNCCKYWDTNNDGELSYAEAAAVESIHDASFDSEIVAFTEFKYFTGIKVIPYQSEIFRSSLLFRVELPIGVEEIESCAFIACPNLKYINFPNSIKSIGRWAFTGAMGSRTGGAVFTSVVLGDSLESIGERAFYVESLKTIYCKSLTPPSGAEEMFYQPYRIYVPKGCGELYRNANYWKDYAVCIEEYDFDNNPIN